LDPLTNTNAIVIGIGATLLVDAWALLRRWWLGTPLPDYGLVGRWIGHMGRGQIRHVAIAAAPVIRAERFIGWSAHYLIGIGFAGALLAILGDAWLRQPTPGPALLFGILTVAAPFLLMQPGMGAGIAASRVRRPGAARLQSLVTHAVFGLGLFVAGSARIIVPGLSAGS
jgi:hypothetical protein